MTSLNTIKTKLNQHDDIMMNHIQIDSKLKQQLHTELTKRANATQPRRWWKFLIPTLSVSALVAVAIIIGVNNKPIIKQALLPQEALAKTITSAFKLSELSATLGLPNDGQLHHRSLDITYQYPDQLDQLLEDDRPTSGAETIDIWANGKAIRKDYALTSALPNLPTNQKTSEIFNSTTGQYCAKNNNELTNCFDESTTTQLDPTTTILSNDPLADGVNALPAEENLIQEFSVQPYEVEGDTPGLIFSWYTSKKISVQLNLMNFQTGVGSGVGGTIPVLENNRYHYTQVIYDDVLMRAGDFFLQVESSNSSEVLAVSMVYQVNGRTLAITPVEPEALQNIITTTQQARQQMLDSQYLGALKPIIYIINNPERFTEPTSINEEIQHDVPVVALRYPLTTHYLLQSGTYLADPTDPTNQFTISLYMDRSQTNFLGYAIEVNNQSVTQIWMTDEILPNDQADTIFAPTTN